MRDLPSAVTLRDWFRDAWLRRFVTVRDTRDGAVRGSRWWSRGSRGSLAGEVAGGAVGVVFANGAFVLDERVESAPCLLDFVPVGVELLEEQSGGVRGRQAGGGAGEELLEVDVV